MEIKLAKIEECTGCEACLTVCNQKAISFKTIKGSLHTYPFVNEKKCKKCGACMKVCPIINFKSEKHSYAPKTYCAWNEDKKIRKTCTSGGVATAFSYYALNQGFYIAGACFDENWHLSHIVSNEESDIKKFIGSKYLLSTTHTCYKDIIKLLQEKNKILFIGTPCQCDAIISLTPKSLLDNLYTISIICHGVNSPIVWNDYVKEIEKKHRSNLLFYNFRSKAKGWGKLYVEYFFEDGQHVLEQARYNLFHVWFGKHLILRESCFNCKYRTSNRKTDLVIGDFWGIEKVAPELYSKEGVSVIISNSPKGHELISKCGKIQLIETDYDQTINELKGFLDKTDNQIKIIEIKNARTFASAYQIQRFEDIEKMYPVASFWGTVWDSFKHRLSKIF